MQLNTFLLSTIATSFISGAISCVFDPRDNTNGSYPNLIMGSDEPADPATTGYVLSHFGLNVKNMTASIEFYTKILGFRLIFDFQATANFSISYLGHSHGGKNGTAYQTTLELNRNKNNMEGLLELISYTGPNAANLEPSTRVQNTFSHIGVVVPDVNATQARFEQFGWPILKRTGEPQPVEGAGTNAYGLGNLSPDEPEAIAILQGIAIVGGDSFLLVLDPDGNLLEIQPQELKQLG